MHENTGGEINTPGSKGLTQEVDNNVWLHFGDHNKILHLNV